MPPVHATVGPELGTVHWDERDAPFGPFSFATSETAVVAAHFGPAADVVDRWRRDLGAGAAERGGGAVAAAGAELDDYLAGRRDRFTVPVDLRLAHGFTRAVLEALCDVPPGATVTYGELAALAGRPGAARAVGGAMARNPVPVFVRCHRVLAAGGRLGGFGGGRNALDIKRWLLAREGAGPRG